MTRGRVGAMVCAALLVMAAVPVSLVGPYLVDDASLDQIVLAVVLDWRDFGLEKAYTRLQFELDARDVGRHVRDEDCVFQEEQGGVRGLRCEWATEVRLPIVGTNIPLSFESQARLMPDGTLQ